MLLRYLPCLRFSFRNSFLIVGFYLDDIIRSSLRHLYCSVAINKIDTYYLRPNFRQWFLPFIIDNLSGSVL